MTKARELSELGSVLTVTGNTVNTLTVNTFTVSTISANGSVGANGQVLTSNGTRTYWANAAAGGGASIGGANTQLLFHDNLTANGSANFTYNKATTGLAFFGNSVNITVNASNFATGGISLTTVNSIISFTSSQSVQVTAQSMQMNSTPLQFYNSGTYNAQVFANGAGMYFYTSSSSSPLDFVFHNGPEVLRLAGNNRVFIGGYDQYTYYERLQVNGAIRMVSGNGIWFADGTQQTTAALSLAPGALYDGNTVVIGNSSTTSITSNTNTNSPLPYKIQSIQSTGTGARFDTANNTAREFISSITYYMPTETNIYSGPVNLDFSRSIIRLNLNTSVSMNLANAPSSTQSAGQFLLLIINPGNGNSITWPGMVWVGNSAPTFTNYVDHLIVLYYDSNYYNNLTGCYIGKTA